MGIHISSDPKLLDDLNWYPARCHSTGVIAMARIFLNMVWEGKNYHITTYYLPVIYSPHLITAVFLLAVEKGVYNYCLAGEKILIDV